jgi:glycosyltransferase involved in cell wall biosynthesis
MKHILDAVAAGVVISPMLQGWGFPTKIVEALACGKVTITTPAGARALESARLADFIDEAPAHPGLPA